MENLTALDVFFCSISFAMAGSIFYLIIRLRRAEFIISLLREGQQQMVSFCEAVVNTTDDLYFVIEEAREEITDCNSRIDYLADRQNEEE